jgi:hypothetical protein
LSETNADRSIIGNPTSAALVSGLPIRSPSTSWGRGRVDSEGIIANEDRLEGWDEATEVAISLGSIKALLEPGG